VKQTWLQKAIESHISAHYLPPKRDTSLFSLVKEMQPRKCTLVAFEHILNVWYVGSYVIGWSNGVKVMLCLPFTCAVSTKVWLTDSVFMHSRVAHVFQQHCVPIPSWFPAPWRGLITAQYFDVRVKVAQLS
jgi:hypothetical protein